MPKHAPCGHCPRSFLRHPVAVICLLVLLGLGCSKEPAAPSVVLSPLPFAMDALAPIISQEALTLHYKKHHAGYVARANALIEPTRFQGKPVGDILTATRGKKKYEALYNNTAQAWNHDFFWRCLSPGENGRPTGELALAIDRDFDGWQGFRSTFIGAATTHFGSGWVWLVSDKGKLRIETTANADTPVAMGLTPLFTIDLWEHAYYLDFQNRRAAYATGIFDKLADWKAVEKRFNP